MGRMSRKRWLRFGPGLVLALIGSAIVWHPFPPARSGPPGIERSHLEALPDAPASVPDPSWLTEEQQTLGLSAAQVRRLSRLRARWDRDTRPLREALTHASAAFEQEMRTSSGQGQTIEQLQERAAPVSQLSRRLADTRRAWWSEAATVLTPSQRQRAEQAWIQRFSRK